MESFFDQSLADHFEISLRKKEAQALENLGLVTVGDLLGHLPRRYEDRRASAAFPQHELDHPVCIHAVVSDVLQTRYGRSRKQARFDVVLENTDPGPLDSPITCRWFSRPWKFSQFVVGEEVIVYGQPRLVEGQLVMEHPEVSVIEKEGRYERIHLGRITPVYGLSEGISQWQLRDKVYALVEQLEAQVIPDYLPKEVVIDFPDWDRRKALRGVHFPESIQEADQARRYLALEAFFLQQLSLQLSQRTYRARPGLPHCGQGRLLDAFLQNLPFDLTEAQTRTIAEIRADLLSTRPMNRLLHGDVGSGKTFVALAAILLTVEAGFQAVFMAPTQLLAEQHAAQCEKWLQPLGIRWALKRGGKQEDDIASDVQVLVGTHALLYDGVFLTNPGLIVIDEQHKFGVSQRNRLIERAELPDVLVMTATPIPRTLTMTVYGDLDVSVLDELPAGRGKLITGIRCLSKTAEAAQFVKSHLDRGRQAYVVCSLIEPSEKFKACSVLEAKVVWENLLPDVRFGIVHGSIEREERQVVMEQFRSGEIQILIATTVIEVGVDVPNANLMLIFDAERFGLAQLHQLRGRIGRGSHKSFCLLMCDLEREEGIEKLRIMEETRDGFRIAEADLAQRGPGDLLGSAQSGMLDQRWTEFLSDTPLIARAQALARSVIEQDITSAEHLAAAYRRTLKAVTESLAHVS